MWHKMDTFVPGMTVVPQMWSRSLCRSEPRQRPHCNLQSNPSVVSYTHAQFHSGAELPGSGVMVSFFAFFYCSRGFGESVCGYTRLKNKRENTLILVFKNRPGCAHIFHFIPHPH